MTTKEEIEKELDRYDDEINVARTLRLLASRIETVAATNDRRSVACPPLHSFVEVKLSPDAPWELAKVVSSRDEVFIAEVTPNRFGPFGSRVFGTRWRWPQTVGEATPPAPPPAGPAVPPGFEACKWEEATSDGERRSAQPVLRLGTFYGHYADFMDADAEGVTWLRPARPAIDAEKLAEAIWNERDPDVRSKQVAIVSGGLRSMGIPVTEG